MILLFFLLLFWADRISENGMFVPVVFAKEIPIKNTLPSSNDAPRIQLHKTSISFGEITSEASVVGWIPFQNVGKRPLKILAIQSSCDCVTVRSVPVVVQPQADGKIEVSLDTAKYLQSDQENQEDHQIALYTNDPLDPVILLDIVASVKEDFIIFPRYLKFGEFLRWQEATKSVVISPIGKEPFQVTSVESTSRHFIPTLTEALLEDGRKHYVVSVTLMTEGVPRRRRLGRGSLGAPPPGNPAVGGRIQIFTNSSRQPVIQIPVTAKVSDS